LLQSSSLNGSPSNMEIDCHALGAAVFFAIVVIAQLALPLLNEVPEGFADVLWNFRSRRSAFR
jgi:hypothetical protein